MALKREAQELSFIKRTDFGEWTTERWTSGIDVYIDFLETKVIVPAGKTIRMMDGMLVN